MSRRNSSNVAVVGRSSYTPGEEPIVLGKSRKRKPFDVSPGLIWGITFVILLVIAIITFVLISRVERETIELPFDEDIQNLDLLQDLDNGGLCCTLTGTTTVSDQYIYLPSTNFTYSQDELDPDLACDGLTGIEYTACIASSTNADNTVAPVAHKGVTLYYAFDVGQATLPCDSYVPCP